MPDQRVYDADEVDRYVAQLQQHISELQDEVANLRQEVSLSAVVGRDEAAERALGRAMIQAQLAADRAADDAAIEAERIINDAHRQRRELLEQTRQEHDRIVNAAQLDAGRSGGAAAGLAPEDAPYRGIAPQQRRFDPLSRTPTPQPWGDPSPSRSTPGSGEPFGRASQTSSGRGGSAPPSRGVPFTAAPPTGRPVVAIERDLLEPPTAGAPGNHRR